MAALRLLEYEGLDVSKVKAAYRRVCTALAAGDFRAAQVKKLAGFGAASLYRAKLSDADRLLFSLFRHEGETVVLLLEVIAQHDYAGSRFLRGAVIDEAHIADESAPEPAPPPLRYLHASRSAVQLLDKPLSFDDAQEAVYRLPAPLVLVGSAGSGKTALVLAKLRHVAGEVLYVTQSAYLARSARELYHAHGYERPGQDVQFLALRELVEAIHLPPGREAGWRDFAAWFAQRRQAFKGLEAHQAFEEIRGVITAGAGGPLSRAEHAALGPRQSIYAGEQRDAAYTLFEQYRAWLAQAGLYDLNLVAHAWLARAAPRYDFVVVDEVQDLTVAQLALVLRTLKSAGQFLLCGDSNQIVHPNFFAWSRVKSLFWQDPALAERQSLQVLAANYRNSPQATALANRLLKIKHSRFGSIDRESNYLVQPVGGEAGQVSLLPDSDAALRELDRASRQSTRFAVLVLRDEDKAEARARFGTPLLFSVQEAKGLEYENIVLYRLVSGHRAEFGEIVAGVEAADLAVDELAYRRARDKGDKSLEVYKFYVNALYVALTRAVKNLYLVEADTGHPLLALLGLAEQGTAAVQSSAASLQDWQREARKLELQGKQEQADAIRQGILRQSAPPWPVFDEPRLRETLRKVFIERAPGGKLRQQLLEYAACHDEAGLANWLVEEGGHAAAANFAAQRAPLARKYLQPYQQRNVKDVLRQCTQHGVDHRTPMNLTPLMAAVEAGNVALVEALLDLGADLEARDPQGRTALHLAMATAFRDPAYAKGAFVSLYERIAPASVDLQAGDRLVRIDRQQSEYFVLQSLVALFKSRFVGLWAGPHGAFDTQTLMDAWAGLPAQVLPLKRRQRAHLSNVLSRNEVARDYAYNRALFMRAEHGWYWLNPKLAARQSAAGDESPSWQPLMQVLNLPLVKEFSDISAWLTVDKLAELAGMPAPPVAMAGQRRWDAFMQEERRRKEQVAERERLIQLALARQAEGEATRRADPGAKQAAPPPAPWGSAAARRAVLDAARERIAENQRRRAAESRGKAGDVDGDAGG